MPLALDVDAEMSVKELDEVTCSSDDDPFFTASNMMFWDHQELKCYCKSRDFLGERKKSLKRDSPLKKFIEVHTLAF